MGGSVLVSVWIVALGFLWFICVMVRQLLMVLLAIMVSQSMSLLDGRVVDDDERLVNSKLLEWLQFCAGSWDGGRDGLLLKFGGLD
jgi:hypothetical protein